VGVFEKIFQELVEVINTPPVQGKFCDFAWWQYHKNSRPNEDFQLLEILLSG